MHSGNWILVDRPRAWSFGPEGLDHLADHGGRPGVVVAGLVEDAVVVRGDAVVFFRYSSRLVAYSAYSPALLSSQAGAVPVLPPSKNEGLT